MVRRGIFLSAAMLLLAGSFTVSAQSDKGTTYTGVITDTICGANHGEGTPPGKCTTICVKQHGAKYALYDPKSKKVYTLDPQDKALGHEGKTVTIMGKLDADGKTLHVDMVKSKAEAKAAGL
jgi:hypothetical protein